MLRSTFGILWMDVCRQNPHFSQNRRDGAPTWLVRDCILFVPAGCSAPGAGADGESESGGGEMEAV